MHVTYAQSNYSIHMHACYKTSVCPSNNLGLYLARVAGIHIKAS